MTDSTRLATYDGTVGKRAMRLLVELRRAGPGVAWEPESIVSVFGEIYADVPRDKYPTCRSDLRILEGLGHLRAVANGWVLPVDQVEEGE